MGRRSSIDENIGSTPPPPDRAGAPGVVGVTSSALAPAVARRFAVWALLPLLLWCEDLFATAAAFSAPSPFVSARDRFAAGGGGRVVGLRRGPAASGPPRAVGDDDDDEVPLSPPDVLCVGEALWDALPTGLCLGGAPTNVAVHLASLGADVAAVARVGSDRLGDEAVRRLKVRGVRTEHVQRSGDPDTGVVVATIDGSTGDALYEFDTPCAWDGLELTDKLRAVVAGGGAGAAPVVVMGTIAGRLGIDSGAASAGTALALRNLAPEGTVVLDVNLRPPWYSPDAVLALARGDGRKLALLKLNDEELPLVEGWCGLAAAAEDGGVTLAGDALRRRMEALGASLGALRVCVTRGADGAALWCDGSSSAGAEAGATFHEHQGYPADAEGGGGGDTVGAGDAFLAALVRSLLLGREPPDGALRRACALGGYVARRTGATPDHADASEELRSVFSYG